MQRLHKIGRRFFTRMLLISALITAASLSVQAADDESAYQLLVKMKNSDEKAFLLANKPIVTFTGTECVIDYNDFTSYFDMGEILDITIKDMSGVQEVVSTTDKVTLDYTDPDAVVVRGVPAGVTVTLHSINGMLLDSVCADADGNARINMSAVSPASICIISVNSNINFKIYKK